MRYRIGRKTKKQTAGYVGTCNGVAGQLAKGGEKRGKEGRIEEERKREKLGGR